ncbi:MAG TPA: hypothetical protein VE054_03650 [Blattabacteriaceae bacterium]|nr:hypothetical protein [Blattabacteriaceae bacterium]
MLVFLAIRPAGKSGSANRGSQAFFLGEGAHFRARYNTISADVPVHNFVVGHGCRSRHDHIAVRVVDEIADEAF